MSQPVHPLRGVALLMCAVFAFASFDATAKFLATRYPVPMLAWVRYTLPALGMLIALVPRHGTGFMRSKRPAMQIGRALMLVCTTVGAMIALRTVSLAHATSILYVAPILVTLLARPVLGERVVPAAWPAAFLGFCGVLLIARPDAHIDPTGFAIMLGVALAYTFYQLLTRRLAAVDSSRTTLFYSMTVGCCVLTAALPWVWQPINAPWPHLLLIASLGGWGLLGHFLLIRAFADAPASTLSPFLYVQMLWALLLGLAVFGHWPDALSLAGTACIACGGLLLAWVERKRYVARIRHADSGAGTPGASG